MADAPESSWQVKASICETPTGTSVWVQVADACNLPIAEITVALPPIAYATSAGDLYATPDGIIYATRADG